MRDIPLQRFRRRRRWSLAPQLIDQKVAGHRLASAQEQDRQKRPVLRAAEHKPSFLVDALHRPQDSESKHDLQRRGNRTTAPRASRRLDRPPTDLPPPPTARLPAAATVSPTPITPGERQPRRTPQ